MIGLVVNPVAGLGGAVGLKGTDGLVEEALARGAVPRASDRAAAAIAALPADVPVATAAGAMGEDALQRAGRTPALLVPGGALTTTADDTRQAVRALADAGVELLLFAGGDGTARDVCAAVGDATPALGIPAGVKIQSAAFAESPRRG
ncbi:MAG: ATP-NAD kinase family protein, partial [Gaiellales bacterium]